MKTLLSLILLVSSLQLRANNVATIKNSIYEIEDTILQNQRRLDRRQKLAKDINAILLEAKSKIQSRLQRNGGGRVDTQLVSIALSACGNLGTWSARANCFKDYLSGARGMLKNVSIGCETISSSSNRTKCYNDSLQLLQNGRAKLDKVALAACGNLGTWSDRKSCFVGMLSNANQNGLHILSESCSTISSSSNSAQCFTRGLNSSNIESDIPALLVAACGNLGTWSDRKTCYVAGVESSQARGLNIMRYVRGCFNISSSSGAAQCFTRSLNEL